MCDVTARGDISHSSWPHMAINKQHFSHFVYIYTRVCV